MAEYYAHSLPGRPQEEWQHLEDHLRNVAEMARSFADACGDKMKYLATSFHVSAIPVGITGDLNE